MAAFLDQHHPGIDLQALIEGRQRGGALERGARVLVGLDPALDLRAVEVDQRQRVIVLEPVERDEGLHRCRIGRCLVVRRRSLAEQRVAFLDIGIGARRIAGERAIGSGNRGVIIAGIIFRLGQCRQHPRIPRKACRHRPCLGHDGRSLLLAHAALRADLERHHRRFARR